MMHSNFKSNFNSIFGLVLSFLGTMLLIGCGMVTSNKPSVDGSMTEATVTGKVLLKGKAATSGTVIFDPSNYVRKTAEARRTEIKPDGTYSITTLTGSNSIRVEGKEINALRGADYAGLSYEVPAGSSTYDIKLPPEESGAEGSDSISDPKDSASEPKKTDSK